MDKENVPKSSHKFVCLLCDYSTSRNSQYNRHLLTDKHKKIIKNNKRVSKVLEEKIKKYICKCGNNYYYSSGLSKHKLKCKIINNDNKDNYNNSNKNDNNNDNDNDTNNNNVNGKINLNENFFEILKQNQEFKELLIEQNKIIMDLSSKVGTNTNINNSNINSNNKTFNLQVFLNEKCKDALNISDFVNSLKLTLDDLENVGDKGFVNGITRIFVNGLKQLDVYKRPIHCSDLKRETMYLKNENVWEKDNENKENMKKVIKQIANKNINKIYEWKDKYPDCKYSDSKKNDQYSRIIIESMGAKTIEEDQILYEKIIKNIAKETIIDKTK